MKLFKNIQVDINQGLATIWLNRPDVHNALNEEMLHELIFCFNKLNNLHETRIILLRGNGKSFCSGADIAWMQQSANSDNTLSIKHSKLLAKCFLTIYESVKPVIALVHGSVIAGGIGILCACDIAVAAENTWFSIPETRIGLVPSTILPYILTRVNQHKAKMLIYTGQKVNTADAMNLGLIDCIFSEPELEIKTIALVNYLLKASPNALFEIKTLIRDSAGKPIDSMLIKKTINTLNRVKTSKEGKEGLTAYIEKRDPAWIQQIMVL